MVAHPASVPAVRRFVDEALRRWGRVDLIDDVALSVTELATNATLHSDSDYFDVELSDARDTVHVAVSDGGSSRSGVGLPEHLAVETRLNRADTERGGLGEVEQLEHASMTGRGLYIVSALASAWGIDDLPHGTRVWADFSGAGPTAGDQEPDDSADDPGDDRAEDPADDRSDGAAPGGRGDLPAEDAETLQARPSGGPVLGVQQEQPPPDQVEVAESTGPTAPARVVELRACPPQLLLAHDQNLNDLARELTLYAASHADEAAAAAARTILDVVGAIAPSWDTARVAASEAIDRGLDTVDITLVLVAPQLVVERVRSTRRAVEVAEQMVRAEQLMTLPAGPELTAWRGWYREEMVEQVQLGREPRPFVAGS